MMKKDSVLLGLLLGLIAPFFGVYIFYFIFFHYMEFDHFIDSIISTQKWVSVLSVSVIVNLGLFFLFYQRELDRLAKGVVAATFIYAFVVVYFKVF